MVKHPNILFLMTDQMQGRVLEPDHVCRTPNLDRLAQRGVRIRNAYTPNPVCSPARASLMTGLLPHSHGVLQVTHCVDDDQGCLRTDRPHWAQRLVDAGYSTAYFGKWHVERTNNLRSFGWQQHVVAPMKVTDVLTQKFSRAYEQYAQQVLQGSAEVKILRQYEVAQPEGWTAKRLYSVDNRDPETRMASITTGMASEFIDRASRQSDPWCCFVSINEPHDPFDCGESTFNSYDLDTIPEPPNWSDDLSSALGLYRKAARAYAGMTRENKKEAAACYYAVITELDQQFGRLLDQLESSGQMDDTIIVFTSDHGELLGAHGLYLKNAGAYEEVYQIPMVLAGPGIDHGVTDARVGLHDLAPTLLDLVGVEPIDPPDCKTFAPLLADPGSQARHYTRGYAEYFGTRYWWTQRVAWEGVWKLVFNGFDFDELYNLEDDPSELRNRIDDPACQDRVRQLMQFVWQRARETGDDRLFDAQNQSLRLAPLGPGICGP